MKKQFEEICNKIGFSISNYKTYRSDFGNQVYEMTVGSCFFSDSYIVGEKGSKEAMMKRFENEILLKNTI